MPFGDHRAHKITPAEFAGADLVIIMDESNRRLLRRIVGEDADGGKVRMMMEFAGERRDVADTWYTGDFEATYRDVDAGCRGIIREY